jgi:NAD(P)-dependent dehydrogenase (short-subunit alcohol dehydrogenase family)
MSTALITGCDYGIGFEFASQYAGDGWRVHAVCLDAESRDKVEALGDVRFHHVDVSDEAVVKALAESLKGEPIDLLINNAATFAPDGPGTLQRYDGGTIEW